MELVYTHMNLFIVENAKNVLDNAGFKTHLKNQFLTSGFGEISGIDSWPELWITEVARKEEANALLLEAGIGTADEAAEGKEWQCNECKEMNADTFQSCWKCSANRPG